jgi:enoyl-CoA hydratase/carnithine racemase
MTDEYLTRFKTVKMVKDELGILTVTLHSRGTTMGWNGLPHTELPLAFAAIAADRDVRVVVLTGAGDRFIDLIPSFEENVAQGKATALQMDDGLFEGNRLIGALLAIEAPVIAAINGPVDVHAELPLLSDIVLCTEDTYFQDAAHVPSGLVPGDGVQVLFPMLLGMNRGRYFLLTGEKIHAEEAKRLGLVGEVLPAAELMDRAYAHARRLAVLNPVVMRNTRLVFVNQIRRRMADEIASGLALEAVASWSGAAWTGPFKPEPLD